MNFHHNTCSDCEHVYICICMSVSYCVYQACSCRAYDWCSCCRIQTVSVLTYQY